MPILQKFFSGNRWGEENTTQLILWSKNKTKPKHNKNIWGKKILKQTNIPHEY